MDKLCIIGGKPLYGAVPISGAKNAALPLLAATLLAPGCHILHNVPDLRDTRTMLHLLETLGAKWQWEGTTVRVDTDELSGAEAPYELVKTMRASVLVLGPLLGRTGFARVSLPGGCAIGARPIDYHLKGFEQLGVETFLEQGYVEARVTEGLKGGEMYFDIPSVTGTENLLMAAVCAQGTTVIENAAREPEVDNLIDMLCGMGASIEGKGSARLTVHGVRRLCAAESKVIADRIEAGTYMIAVAACGGNVLLKECEPAHLTALMEKLRQCGLIFQEELEGIRVRCPEQEGNILCPLQSIDITTKPYPGFPTDLQAQFMALMALCEDTSVIHETIFENRFMHVAELNRMGADIAIKGPRAIVRGGGRECLSGAEVMATDLRASASLVIAALAAKGETTISRIYHLERGYENMVQTLRAVGAQVERISD